MSAWERLVQLTVTATALPHPASLPLAFHPIRPHATILHNPHLPFSDYAVNSVLYQRGIYPPDEFEQTKAYGLPMLVSKEKGVKSFIDNIMTQSSGMYKSSFSHSLSR